MQRNGSQLTSELVLSRLRYYQLEIPSVQVSLWVISVTAILLNVFVLIWRLRLLQKRHLNFINLLVTNLAGADALIATSNILAIVAARSSKTWYAPTTSTVKSVCSASFVLRHGAFCLSTLLMVMVAVVGIQEIFKRSCLRVTSKRGIVVSVAILWILSISYSVVFSLISYDQLEIGLGNSSRITDWSVCDSSNYFNFHYPVNAAFFAASTLLFLILVLIASYVCILIFLCRLKRRGLLQHTTFTGAKGGAVLLIAFINGLALLAVFAWNLHFPINYERYGSSVQTVLEDFNTPATVAYSFVLPLLTFFNPLIFTLATKQFWLNVRRLLSRHQNRQRRTSSILAPRPSETTGLFEDPTKTRSSGWSEDWVTY